MNPIRIEIPAAPDAQADALRRAKVAELRIILAAARVDFRRASRNVIARQMVENWLSGRPGYDPETLVDMFRKLAIINPSLRI
jgi:hypothetical protein